MAVHFADLHDTPGRMKAKGVIRKQVQWAESRAFFFWRLRRRLCEFTTVNACGAQAEAGQRKHAIAALRTWFLTQQGGTESEWEDDRGMVEWFQENAVQVQAYTAEVRSQACVGEIRAKLSELVRAATSAQGVNTAEVLRQALTGLQDAERAEILSALAGTN